MPPGFAMGEPFPSRVIASPVGPLLVVANRAGVRALVFAGARDPDELRREQSVACGGAVVDSGHPLLTRAAHELRSYFEGRRRAFTLPLDLHGTPFQRHVWDVIGRVAYGETISYQTLAERIGRPRAVRAVGNACARNPLPIIVPCHRVVAQDNALAGYVGGIAVKRRLLVLERSEVTDLPLLRLVTSDPAGAEPEAIDTLPAPLYDWLIHPRRRNLAPDLWLAEAMDAVPSNLWPTLADQLHASDVDDRDHLVDELLDAWAAEVTREVPDPRALARFVEVAARRGGAAFELVGRRLVAAPELPEACQDALSQQLERIMSGELRSTPYARELSVDLWLALDPDRHLAELSTLLADDGAGPDGLE